MAGSSNFKVFNPNLTNIMSDLDYNLSNYRLNGAVSGLAPSNIHNKLYYQVTTFVAAMAESLANQGYVVSDSNYSNLVTVLSSILNTAGGNLTGALNEAKGTNIASAATTNIGTATGNFVQVTGTTTITALGTAQAGAKRTVNFTGSLTLTHNATSLILPGSANIAINAGDICEFVSLGSGNWECTNYQPSLNIYNTKQMQAYTTAGTFTFTAPVSGLYKVIVIGAGGGGGGVVTTSTQTAASGGGGGGGCSIKTVALTVGQTVSITVGAGGNAGAYNTNGSTGGTTSFGAFCSATGGIGSAKADSNSVAAGSADVTGGVNGGNGSNGDLNLYGGVGGDPMPEAFGGTGGFQVFYEGKGGDSYLNKGQRGANGSFGSGASGRALNTYSGSSAGYSGGNGCVIIEW